MAGQNGGARAGAGRKRKLEKYQSAIEKAELSIADKLPQLKENLEYLANGGYQRVEEEYQPAGMLMRTTTDKEGNPYQVPMFPDKKPDELVLVKRKVTVADKDRAANIYLMDRVMGKPIQKVAPTTPDGKEPYDGTGTSAREFVTGAIAGIAARMGTAGNIQKSE